MRKIAIAILVTSSLVVSACNTVRGVGRDVASVGNAVADAAE